ncbi:hypothetical protein ENTCAN_07919 [Enterobacter cancerogenus ATCC 35316]|nr:hypothetical protein ENTCAN_07919 [Enterobacter cancerogenus ATCC 35316]
MCELYHVCRFIRQPRVGKKRVFITSENISSQVQQAISPSVYNKFIRIAKVRQ